MKANQSSDDWKAMEAYMDAVEGNGPQTTLFALLEQAHVGVPPPDTMSSDARSFRNQVLDARSQTTVKESSEARSFFRQS
jgi:hypothetical protein